MLTSLTPALVGPEGGKKGRVLQLELQVAAVLVEWVLGIELEFPAGTVYALNL